MIKNHCRSEELYCVFISFLDFLFLFKRLQSERGILFDLNQIKLTQSLCGFQKAYIP